MFMSVKNTHALFFTCLHNSKWPYKEAMSVRAVLDDVALLRMLQVLFRAIALSNVWLNIILCYYVEWNYGIQHNRTISIRIEKNAHSASQYSLGIPSKTFIVQVNIRGGGGGEFENPPPPPTLPSKKKGRGGKREEMHRENEGFRRKKMKKREKESRQREGVETEREREPEKEGERVRERECLFLVSHYYTCFSKIITFILENVIIFLHALYQIKMFITSA